jgi:hypothetical protein
MLSDFPIAPPIEVKDYPKDRRLKTLQDARMFVDDALATRRTAAWRDLHARLNGANTEDEAVEAIGALRELLMMEGLLDSSSRSNV